MKAIGTKEEQKCLNYFGLRFNPFPVVPDVDNFYVCSKIDRVLTEIFHGIVTRKGFLVLTGEIGLGKTTISRKIMRVLEEERVNTSLVFHSVCQGVELLREINRDFGIQSESLVLADQVKALREYLLSEHQKGKNSAILIDDAQNLSHESLELIRTISNLETDQEKLVQVLLVGQPELADKLESPHLRQLKSRIMVSQEVEPLGREELLGYVMFKLYMAGNAGTITVTKSAVRKVHGLTDGNFRRVNRLMERCLYVALLRNTCRISGRLVGEAHRDLRSRGYGRFGRRFAWGLVATILLYVAGWWVLPGGYSGLTGRQADGFGEMSIVGKNPSSHGTAVSREESVALCVDTVPAGDEKEKDIPGSIRDFMEAYGLSEFTAPFFQAVREGRLRYISDRIYRWTGYRMVCLDRLTDEFRSAYTILHLSMEGSERNRYILFWKPKLEIENFYLHYEGEEIRELETLLMAEGLYRYELDGLVGPKLMTAVNRFQRQNGLPVTGFPDSETIFLLCQVTKKDTHE